MPIIITAPEALKVSRLSPKAVNAAGLSESPFTFARQIQQWPGQRWEFGLTLPPLTRDDAETVLAFLLSVSDGSAFYWGPPGKQSNPRGSVQGDPVARVVAGVTALGNVLYTSGWSPDQQQVVMAGDWCQVGDHLHKAIANADADGSGYADLTLWPAPRSPYPAAGDAIVFASPVGLFQLKDFSPEWDVDTASHYGMAVNIVEKL